MVGPLFLMLSLIPKKYLHTVTHRATRGAVIFTACMAALFAFASGMAAGRYFGGAAGAALIALDGHRFATGAVGRSNGAVPDARIERLAAQVAALNEFNERLRTQPPSGTPTAVAFSNARSSEDRSAEGGPELPPNRCLEASAARQNAKAIHDGQANCMAATLAALESQVAQHVAAWEAFPGRRPIEGGRNGSPYGNRIDPFSHRLSFHPGIDLVAPSGTPILAAAGGRVIYAGPKRGYGNAVEIDHGNGFITRYGHASKIDVHTGQIVQARDHIADVGSTGRSTGPHLHFEVLINRRPVNPAGYLALFAPVLDA